MSTSDNIRAYLAHITTLENDIWLIDSSDDIRREQSHYYLKGVQFFADGPEQAYQQAQRLLTSQRSDRGPGDYRLTTDIGIHQIVELAQNHKWFVHSLNEGYCSAGNVSYAPKSVNQGKPIIRAKLDLDIFKNTI